MTQEEENIARYFDAEGEKMAKKHEDKGIPNSAKIQVDDIVASKAKKAVDVGSGPGSVLLKLLEGGVDEVIGVDLSDEMIKISKDRIKDHNMEDRVTHFNGSFLDLDLDEDVDAISLHCVLCCHPDREGMLKKTMGVKPKLITLTIPRSWFVLRILVKIFNIIAKKLNKFSPYIHSQKNIDKQLISEGYKIINRHKGLAWVTTSYSLS